MEEQQLLNGLFRKEFRKMCSVLSRIFGLENLEVAEDIAADTFLLASEIWVHKGIPENPAAWLYQVAKNKAKDHLKHKQVFRDKIRSQIIAEQQASYETEIDFSNTNINNSQLQMIFAVCNPLIPAESQVALALRILCGFGIDEIAAAFLSSKDTINKRLFRARQKLRDNNISLEFPEEHELNSRLESVLTTLYLLFSEGYYTSGGDSVIKKDLCVEAMHLNFLLTGSPLTNRPQVNALLSLMCFQASRFEARTDSRGASVLYEDQDSSLWDQELIQRGNYFLLHAATKEPLSKYHLEAAIAYWHTLKNDSNEKWQSILNLYNQLLLMEYSPSAALNRCYSIYKLSGREEAIQQAQKLDLDGNFFYHALLGELYTGLQNDLALIHLKKALELSRNFSEIEIFNKKINALEERV